MRRMVRRHPAPKKVVRESIAPQRRYVEEYDYAEATHSEISIYFKGAFLTTKDIPFGIIRLEDATDSELSRVEGLVTNNVYEWVESSLDRGCIEFSECELLRNALVMHCEVCIEDIDEYRDYEDGKQMLYNSKRMLKDINNKYVMTIDGRDYYFSYASITYTIDNGKEVRV